MNRLFHITLIALAASAFTPSADAMFAFKRDPNLDWAAEFQKGQEIRDLMWELQVSEVDRCGERTVGQTGIRLADGKPRWDSLEDFYDAQGWSYGNSVVQLAAGSPAEQAGVRVGDIVTRIDGKRIKRRKDHDEALDNHKRLAKAEKRREQFEIEVLRGEEKLSFTLTPVKVCDIRPRLVHVHYVNNEVFGGRESMLDQKQLARVRTPEELRILVTHEFSHHALGHYRRRETIGTVGNFAQAVTGNIGAGLVAGVVAYAASDEEEIAADADAFQILSRAGFGLDAIVDFWAHVAAAPEDETSKNPYAHRMDETRMTALRSLDGAAVAQSTPEEEPRT